VPLTEAEDLPGEELPADRRLEQRERSAMALAAIAGLPDKLREPAMLFFVHECSHLDIAIFLGLPVATVNNRLHAARSKLKERMLVMVNETFHAHALPDDFANRIGRLIEARGAVVEALFNPDAPPDVLTKLAGERGGQPARRGGRPQSRRAYRQRTAATRDCQISGRCSCRGLILMVPNRRSYSAITTARSVSKRLAACGLRMMRLLRLTTTLSSSAAFQVRLVPKNNVTSSRLLLAFTALAYVLAI